MKILCNGQVVLDKVKAADTFTTRLIGLMGRKQLEDGEGLLITPCSAIHCFFMKIPIDAVYLSKEMTVLGIETLSPWQLGSRFRHTASVLETKAGAAASFGVGEKLIIQTNGDY